jgi:DNA-binding NarL/FixJ family response regulator
MTDQSSDQRPDQIRVVVADDQDIVRDGLVTVLSLLDDVDVVGQARNGRECVDAVRKHRPDAVLMDLRMPEVDGAAATALISAEFPEVAVLVLTTYEDDESISRALTAGARGYLTKDASRHDIAAALRSVVRGQSSFDARVTARLVAGLRSPAPDPAPLPGTTEALATLTLREREVLRLIGDGLNNAEISAELFISASTVKTHINNLFAKLHLRDRPEAVRLAAGLPRQP